MDTSNWRPTQGEPTLEYGDWRAELRRQRVTNKIMDTLKKHLPFSGYERQQELKRIAERVEVEIYTASTSQSEYSRMICLNMLTMETRLQTPMRSNSNSAVISVNPSVPLDSTANGRDWQKEVYQKIKAMKELYLLESGDWRTRLQAESRQRIVNKIMDTLRRHSPFSGHEELQELKKIATRFEEKTYIAATSQSDYLRKISLKMLTMETRSQDSISDPMQLNSAANSDNPSDPGSQAMQQVNNQGQQLPIPVSFNNIQQVMSQSVHSNIGSTGMQGSSSFSYALPPGSGLQQPTMASVVDQNSNLQNIQYMPGAQRFQLLQQRMLQQQILVGQQNKLLSLLQPSQQLIGQSTMTNVAGQNLNMQNIQNMASVQQNQLIGQQYNYSDTQQQLMLLQQKLQQPMLQQQRNAVQKNQVSSLQQPPPQRLRPTEGSSGVVVDPTMEFGDWRAQLPADSRGRIMNKILDTLKRYFPLSGEQELNKIAERVEDEIYTVATSQSDYLRKISLKMLTIETRSQNPISDTM